MKHGLIAVQAEDAMLLLARDNREVTWPFARMSDPLFAAFYRDEFVCLLGFIPETLLGNRAYLWLNDTEAMKRHAVLAGLYARRLIKVALLRYPTLVGHCAQYSERWLKSLGARIEGNMFIIEANHG